MTYRNISGEREQNLSKPAELISTHTHNLPTIGTTKFKTMKAKAIATKFVSHEVPDLNHYRNSKVYRLREKINNGENLNREEKNWIAEKVNHNAYFKRAIPLMGYRYGFEDILKTFLVKQYGDWQECLVLK